MEVKASTVCAHMYSRHLCAGVDGCVCMFTYLPHHFDSWGSNNTRKSRTVPASKGPGLAFPGLPRGKIKTKSASTARSSQIPQGFIVAGPT